MFGKRDKANQNLIKGKNSENIYDAYDSYVIDWIESHKSNNS